MTTKTTKTSSRHKLSPQQRAWQTRRRDNPAKWGKAKKAA
jgi:hypothetical protein